MERIPNSAAHADPPRSGFGSLVQRQIHAILQMEDFRTYAPYCSNLPRASSFLQSKRKEPAFAEVYRVRAR